ncbi:MAG TPA: hypothetical protein VG605_12235 [Puia sp.]|nr:hypothetical protein [Puia sp.]
MKKEDIPQDTGAFGKITKEVQYAIDAGGNYTTGLSKGWEVKNSANDAAWQDIEERVHAAREKVMKKEASPLLYFMELKLMDVKVLAGYTGFRAWRVRRHLRPDVFKKLSDRRLQRYAEVFEVPVEELKSMMPQ